MSLHGATAYMRHHLLIITQRVTTIEVTRQIHTVPMLHILTDSYPC